MQIIRSLKIKLLGTSVLVLALGVVTFISYQIDNQKEQLISQQRETLQNVITSLYSEGRVIGDHVILPETVSYPDLNRPGSGLVALVCNQQTDKVAWHSKSLAKLQNPDAICLRIDQLMADQTSQFITVNLDGYESQYVEFKLNNRPILLQLSAIERKVSGNSTGYIIAVVKLADKLEEKVLEAKHQAYRRGLFLFFFFTAIFYFTIKWNLRSLNQMANELTQIKQGKREKLSSTYEPELLNVTSALNQLIDSERAQKERYQNSMNDLAHSLKTRLALLRAVNQDNKESSKDFDNILNDQVSQMDQIVHYQLRRAVSGRSSILAKPVPVAAEAQKLLTTLDKVYSHKGVKSRLEDPDNSVFFGQQDDLMELLGNLLDNAYKFCISQVKLSCQIDKDQGLTLLIEDDGLGVDDAIRKDILKRGVRADSSGGQGIGLAVASEIVDSYSGSISIFNSELGGAGFKLTFSQA